MVGMKHGSNPRRGRSRGGNSGKRHQSSRNQAHDSNGPEGKVRGSAQQVHEKYLSLARDATSAGEHIAAEGFYQFAEHYYRIVNSDAANSQNRNRQQQNGQQQAEHPQDDQKQENTHQVETQPGETADVASKDDDLPEPGRNSGNSRKKSAAETTVTGTGSDDSAESSDSDNTDGSGGSDLAASA